MASSEPPRQNEIRGFGSVKWAQIIDQKLTSVWSKVPWPINKIIVFLAVLALGISINGDWINLWIHLSRQMGYRQIPTESLKKFDWSLESFGLKDLLPFFVGSLVASYAIYFAVGGFVQWYFYVLQRDQPEVWKCQPTKFMTPELELDELLIGCSILFVNVTASGALACYVNNGGYCTIYYGFAEYGWTWFFLQFAAIFVFQDYVVYWIHRTLHRPLFYKRFHKMHHKYKYPTAWSVTAMHPVESLVLLSGLTSPIFLFPVHWLPFYIVMIYNYYHGIIDHSGVDFKAFWWQPWQPGAIFHDDHHKYFHVNFAFNIYFWDILHGTFRQKERVYNENIYYGRGKSLKEATAEEIAVDADDKHSENPFAYENYKQK